MREGTPDQAIARLAQGAHGAVTRCDLLEAGVSPSTIHRRIAQGLLVPLHPGVYVVATAPVGDLALWRAGTLAGAHGAVLSHVSAALLWKIWRGRERIVHVSSPRRARGSRRFRFHVSASLDGATTSHHGIPVTTPARTIVDTADQLTPWQVTNVMYRAAWHGLLDLAGVERERARLQNRRGSAVATRALALYRSGSCGTRSFGEDQLLGQVLAAGLPEPLVNTPVRYAGQWIERDLVWLDAGVAVEVDGPQHARPHDVLADGARDSRVVVERFEAVRFSDDQVRDGTALAWLRARLG